jgi:hypothetical protein
MAGSEPRLIVEASATSSAFGGGEKFRTENQGVRGFSVCLRQAAA